MQETLSPDLVKLAAKSARDEYTDGAVYQMLSRHEKNQAFKKALEDLARGEDGEEHPASRQGTVRSHDGRRGTSRELLDGRDP